ncbi:MAG TPA: GAF domain-containing protein [Coleofasciculaceae cyanobacterium]
MLNPVHMSKSYTVHPQYLQAVQSIWKRKSAGHEQKLADELGLSLPIVHLFLKGRPINGLNFLEICQTLGLNWRKVAGLELQENATSTPPETIKTSNAIQLSSQTENVSPVDEALNTLVATLCEMLRRLTCKAGNLLNAERTSIFLLDRYRKKLGSINAEDGRGGSLVIDIPSDRGIASLAAASSQPINIPFDVYDDPRSEEAKNTDKKTGYRTYTILAWPLLNQQQNLVAVVQFINKLKPNYDPDDDLFKRVDPKGFTSEDEELFVTFAPSILKILEECQRCYHLTQKLSASKTITKAGRILSENELIASLKQQEQQLQRSLARM